jgi:hypothetical protein
MPPEGWAEFGGINVMRTFSDDEDEKVFYKFATTVIALESKQAGYDLGIVEVRLSELRELGIDWDRYREAATSYFN